MRVFLLQQYYPDENESISFAAKEGNTFLNRDILFIAKIKIGSQKQIFNLLLDTGSSILWVGRNTCGGNNKIINKFNPSTSSTAIKTIDTFSIQYGSGSCSGYYYLDNIVYISDKDFAMKFGVALFICLKKKESQIHYRFRLNSIVILLSQTLKELCI